MGIKRALHYAYGLMMGTSVPLLKAVSRPSFPLRKSIFDINGISEASVYLGGVGNGLWVKSGKDILVVNTNGARSGDDLLFEFRTWLGTLTEQPRCHLVLQSLAPEYSAKVVEWRSLADFIYVNPGSHFSAAERAEVFGEVEESWITPVTEKKSFQIGQLNVELEPFQCVTGTDLTVTLPGLSLLGPLFYNKIHPVLRYRREIHPKAWIEALEQIAGNNRQQAFLPGEGEIGDFNDLQAFIEYLKTLSDTEIEFSICRQQFDWSEVPGYTSLEENVVFLQEAARSDINRS